MPFSYNEFEIDKSESPLGLTHNGTSLNLIELKGQGSLESFFATFVSWFVLVLVSADDNLNAAEMGVT
jgi:hypothetical protein